MELLHRPRRIRRVDDHGAVRLDDAAFERIGRAAAVSTGEGGRPPIRVGDHVRLVRGTPLQIDVPHPAHVSLLAALADAAAVVMVVRQDLSCRQRCDRDDNASQRALARGDPTS